MLKTDMFTIHNRKEENSEQATLVYAQKCLCGVGRHTLVIKRIHRLPDYAERCNTVAATIYKSGRGSDYK